MSTFGKIFKVTTFGESHCKGVGCIIEGVPGRMLLCNKDVQTQLTRRRPGQSALTTPRKEADSVEIYSGTESGVTLGTPVMMLVHNLDHRPGDYGKMADIPRPSHADYTYQAKYGVRASSGGGRASARETIGRVAAGAVAEKFLKEKYGTDIIAYVSAVGPVEADRNLESDDSITRTIIDSNLIRTADLAQVAAMTQEIEAARDDHDSIGGVVTCVCRNVPEGLGEPCFDKLEAMLAHAMLSIPATKGFEIGSGFEGVRMRGSAHNDKYVKKGNRLGTETNRSGGIQGGISNGENIVFRLAFKPPATIMKDQEKTADFNGDATTLVSKGRHDPCVVPRAVAIVEAMAALVLADAALLQEARIASAQEYVMLGKCVPQAFDVAKKHMDDKAAASSSSGAPSSSEPAAKKQKM